MPKQEFPPKEIAALKKWLRDLREEKGLTQAEVGREIGRDGKSVLLAENQDNLQLPQGMAMYLWLRELGVLASEADLGRPPSLSDRLAAIEAQVAGLATSEDLQRALAVALEAIRSQANPGTATGETQ